jgi:5-methylcytosine-specific restriction endonuclease McrA
MAKPVLDRLAYLKNLTNIRRGVLPTVRSGVRLESDEICHLETDATYHKVNAKSVSLVFGRLVATNKKLHFLSPSGGSEIAYKSIKRIETQAGGVYLELSKKAGNGRYSVVDPVLTEAVIDTLVRMANRELIAPQAEGASRHIPQEVKQAVWQRDQGKCVQCSATSYLEFDHIIPHSKGGASTANNVQLLCRKCNLEKSDRI